MSPKLPKKAILEAVSGNQRPLKKWVEKQGWLDESSSEVNAPSEDLVKIRSVWQRWMETFGHLHSGRKPTLTTTKQSVIRSRLKKCSVDDLNSVIDYIITDDWWMGDNNNSEPYYFIDNIFRSDDRVEKLLIKADAAKKKNIAQSGEADELKLKVSELSGKIRSGDIGFVGKRKYVELVRRVESLTGETFDWDGHKFVGNTEGHTQLR